MDRCGVTDLAKGLRQVVVNDLTDTDRRRKSRRGKNALEKYHRATVAIIADFLLGFRREKSPL